MSATPVNKEEVRAVVMELGYNEASAKLGIKACTLRQWAKRFNWNGTIKHSQETVTTVTKPIQVLADELADNERETRLSLSRYARRAIAAVNKSVHPAKWTKEAKDIAQTAGITHRWGDQEGKASHFTLNVLNLNSLEVRQEAEVDTLDA